MKKIGILDIQGSVEEHFKAVKKSGETPVLVKTRDDLYTVSGLIIPGGESTTLGKLLRRFGLRDEIVTRAEAGMPIWGTCAGAILMAKNLVGEQSADFLELMDIKIERNAYGRQLDSFEGRVEFEGEDIPGIFIRAPKIVSVGDGVKILSKYDDEIIAAREENLFVTTFHPELTDNTSVHRYFIEMC